MTDRSGGAERMFTIAPAKRGAAPVRVGLIGPSGSGKTYSALRLARGLAGTTDGPIALLDAEHSRSLIYADEFDFLHLNLKPPFGAKDYRLALRKAARAAPSVIIIDSLSPEHDGEGGLLDSHDKELVALAGDDPALALKYTSIAWRRARRERRALLSALVSSRPHLIITFRAAERQRAPRDDNACSPDPGLSPVTGAEYLHEMTCTALLRGGSRGRAVWTSANPIEANALKRPGPIEHILSDGRALDEEMGAAMGAWSRASDPACRSQPRRAAKGETGAAPRAQSGRARRQSCAKPGRAPAGPARSQKATPRLRSERAG